MHEDVVIDILKEQVIDLISSLPCDKAKDLFFMLPEHFNHIGLTREEDGIGVSAGAALAGKRPAMAIQSSGIGNALNALMSLTKTYDLPLPIIASWRGGVDEKIPAQIPFNKTLPAILKVAGISYTVIGASQDLEKISDVITDSFEHSRPHVALVVPGAWGGSELSVQRCPVPSRAREISFCVQRSVHNPEMIRCDAIRIISRHLDTQAVVSNIGIPGKELYTARDRPLNFYMLGSYTQASPLGLGIAKGTQRDVWVLDGDGSILGTGILPVIGAQQPLNLTIFCLDNGAFGSTGNQLTPAYRHTDLELLAIAAGITNTWRAQNGAQLEAILEGLGRGPNFVHIMLKPGNTEVNNIPLTPHEIRDRFMHALRQ